MPSAILEVLVLETVKLAGELFIPFFLCTPFKEKLTHLCCCFLFCHTLIFNQLCLCFQKLNSIAYNLIPVFIFSPYFNSLLETQMTKPRNFHLIEDFLAGPKLVTMEIIT